MTNTLPHAVRFVCCPLIVCSSQFLPATRASRGTVRSAGSSIDGCTRVHVGTHLARPERAGHAAEPILHSAHARNCCSDCDGCVRWLPRAARSGLQGNTAGCPYPAAGSRWL